MSDDTLPKKNRKRAIRRPKAYPYSMRRNALQMVSHGVSFRVTAERLVVSPGTVVGWCKEADVKTGSKLTDDEITAKMEVWRERLREKGIEIPEDGTDGSRQEQKERKKFGATPEEKKQALLNFQGLGDPDQYKETIQSHFDRVNAEMSRANNPEEAVNSAVTGILLVQLKSMIDSPPPIVTWSDGEKVIKLLRLTLGMDEKKGSNSEGVDLRVINGRIRNRSGNPVLDA